MILPTNVKLNELLDLLRLTSSRYGGIESYLAAAGDLERAITGFFKEQDIETLRELNSQLSRCLRIRKNLAPATGTDDGDGA